MKINKAFKLRIYPTDYQIELIENFFGCSRFIYNKMLEERINAYKTFKNNNDLRCLWEHKYKTEKQYKEEFEFLNACESTCLQQSRMDLSNAYINFFKSLSGKSKGHNAFPKFHKKGIKESIRFPITNSNVRIDFNTKKIKLPKLKWINYSDNRIFNDYKLCSATLSKTSTNKYFVSVLCEKEIPDIKKIEYSDDLIIKGLDMSLTSFYIDNQNNHPEYIKQFNKYQDRIAYLKRKASRKKLGSNNRLKAQFRVNKVMEKITNSRKDFIEKLSTNIIRNNDVIAIESLNMKEMSQTLKLGKSVNDLGWGLFVNRLEQKIALTPKILIKADKWFASTKTCHICGYVNHKLTLKDREWDCPKCHSHILRDENSAINLTNYARQELSGEPVEMSSVEESMKQEATKSLD